MAERTISRKVRRTRIFMIIVFLFICASVGGLFLDMQRIAAERQKNHQHSFYQYVVTHHVGTLTEIDDGTGLTPLSYVLVLNTSIADSKIPAFATQMMKLYVQDDRGSALTIEQTSPGIAHPYPIAQAQYNDEIHQLVLTVTPLTGHTRKMVENVDW